MEQFLAQNWLVLTLIGIWTLPWKGVALWKAARLKQKGWFVTLLIINTLALLDILYIFVLSKRTSADKNAA